MNLTGRHVRLRPMEEADLPLKVAWVNDPEVHANLHYEIPLSLSRTRKWFETASLDRTRRDFMIELVDGKPIGMIGFIGINDLHSTAECYIAVGEKGNWGRGLATEALVMLLRWAFEVLGMYKVIVHARTTNRSSIALMKRVGFQIEGTLREEKYIEGRRVDVIRAGLLPHEFIEDAAESMDD